MSIRQRGFVLFISYVDPTTIGIALKETVPGILLLVHLFSVEIQVIPRVWLEHRKFRDKTVLT